MTVEHKPTSAAAQSRFAAALTQRTMNGVYAAISEWAGTVVSSRPMTRAEREEGMSKPWGVVDRQSIEARSAPVSTDCPHCGTDLAMHQRGSVALDCPK